MKTLFTLFILASCALAAAGPANVAIMPIPSQQFLDANGNPYSGGKLYTYISGTSTPLATYTSGTGLTTLPNPGILDSAGRCCSANSAGGMWLGAATYRITLKNSSDVQVWSIDGIRGNNLFSLANVSLIEAASAPSCDVGSDVLWADSVAHRFTMCNNAGSADTVVGAASTDTLTNKTLTSPTINTPTITGGTLSGTIAGSPTLSGNLTFSGTNTHSGSETFSGTALVKKLNNIQFADQFAGATADVQITAAITALPSTGGIVDARGYGATQQTLAAQTAIGTATKPVTLLLSPQTYFSVTITGGVCALPIADGSGITTGTVNNLYNPTLPSNQKAAFVLSATANVSAVFCAANAGGQQTIYLNGVAAQGNATATLGTALFDMQGLAAGSRIENSATATCYGTALKITPGTSNNITSDVLFVNNNFACGGTTGSTPLVIDALSNTKLVANIAFLSSHFQNAGSAQSLVTMNGRGASGPGTGIYGVHFYSCDFEVSSSSADAITIADARNVSFDLLDVSGTVGTAVNVIKLTESAGNLTYNVEIKHAAAASAGGFTHLIRDGINAVNYDGTVVNNVFQVPDFCFRCTRYQSVVNFPEQAAPSGFAGSAVCYADSTAHTVKCSYNNASFYSQTQTIGTGNVTTAGSAVNAGTCQAQTGITVTGAAVTDNVFANIGAALPATWQTGIVLSAHITAVNTATVYLCNPTAGNITPAATAVNVRVVR